MAAELSSICQRCGNCVPGACPRCAGSLCARLTGEKCAACGAKVYSLPNQGRSTDWDRMFDFYEAALANFPSLAAERRALLDLAGSLGYPWLDGRPAGPAIWGYEVTAARPARLTELRAQLDRLEAARG